MIVTRPSRLVRPVIPLGETVRICRENPFVYEPALEMFDELYATKTGIKYDTY